MDKYSALERNISDISDLNIKGLMDSYVGLIKGDRLGYVPARLDVGGWRWQDRLQGIEKIRKDLDDYIVTNEVSAEDSTALHRALGSIKEFVNSNKTIQKHLSKNSHYSNEVKNAVHKLSNDHDYIRNDIETALSLADQGREYPVVYPESETILHDISQDESTSVSSRGAVRGIRGAVHLVVAAALIGAAGIATYLTTGCAKKEKTIEDKFNQGHVASKVVEAPGTNASLNVSYEPTNDVNKAKSEETDLGKKVEQEEPKKKEDQKMIKVFFKGTTNFVLAPQSAVYNNKTNDYIITQHHKKDGYIEHFYGDRSKFNGNNLLDVAEVVYAPADEGFALFPIAKKKIETKKATTKPVKTIETVVSNQTVQATGASNKVEDINEPVPMKADGPKFKIELKAPTISLPDYVPEEKIDADYKGHSRLILGAGVNGEGASAKADYLGEIAGDESRLLFLNLRGSAGNNIKASAGLGYRTLALDDKVILGINGSFDIVQTSEGNGFSGESAGVELFSKYVDVSANAFFGGGKTKETINGSKRVSETSLDGFDVGAALNIPVKDSEVKIYGKYYSLKAEDLENISGLVAGSELSFGNGIVVEGSYDFGDNFKGDEFYIGARVEVPFSMGNLVRGKNPFRATKHTGLAGRLNDPIRRSISPIVYYSESDVVAPAESVATRETNQEEITPPANDGGRDPEEGGDGVDNDYQGETGGRGSETGGDGVIYD